MEETKKKEVKSPIKNAFSKALSGGLAGMSAMAIQVLSLMWLRTTVNYQYRNGTSMIESFKVLYSEGGIRRFYRGLAPALFQGPLSRFGDTASNDAALAYLDSLNATRNLPVGIKTGFASVTAGLFRILLMPIDTLKTSLQVSGKEGIPILKEKFKNSGPRIFFNGAIAASAATFVGHYPWFFIYNLLNARLPRYERSEKLKNLMRSAFMGFAASVVSDTISNSFRVIKTNRQTMKEQASYI
jgi:hypothetical protein